MIDTVTLEEISGDKIVIIRIHKNGDLSSYLLCVTAIITGERCVLKALKDASIKLNYLQLGAAKLYNNGVRSVEWIHHKKQFKVKLVKVDNEVKIKKVQ